LQEATDLGITLYAGEAEDGLEELLRDAHGAKLRPLYNHMAALPNLVGVPIPHLPSDRIARTAGFMTTFDASRGCPFQCSFCAIINVQGRVSRRRTPDDVEAIVRRNAAQGVHSFFITDDNFAHNKDWEPIFDRLIALREQHGFSIKLTIQVDMLCHRIPRFIEKAEGQRRISVQAFPLNSGSVSDTRHKVQVPGERHYDKSAHTARPDVTHLVRVGPPESEPAVSRM
jgi:radical SAM superfamily enzyme YgiQ (UPF0313 family)